MGMDQNLFALATSPNVLTSSSSARTSCCRTDSQLASEGLLGPVLEVAGGTLLEQREIIDGVD